jgi:hypothetical protein
VNPLSLALLILGCAAITYGCWLVIPPAGFVVGGVLACVLAVGLLSVDERQGKQ